ncbi:YcjF family protein [Facklamia sp. 7083-14-GEN3]|uniref:YcjF family protein n=1 Tax=Facklamia sp. 7083-14-GEN3 TaxID=2973478 RepID=UPI00215D4DBC|nr:YcjF family protein [Facklamia sp. 7083-14-GEN3]MCR8968546.1 YcjF family protein [Facklamia sp. 7083-14-GEN3]
MNNWRQWLKLVASAFLIITIIFIFNQFMQLYRNLAYIHPLLALAVILILAIILIYFTFLTVRELMKLPKEIDLADGASPEEYEEYVKDTLTKLNKNRTLKELKFDWHAHEKLSVEEQIHLAHYTLREHGLMDIKKQAQMIFLTTAISQNGSLDSLTVLVVLIKMVWHLIKVYDTRPSFGKVLSIYTNVATTILMARGIEDLDLIEAQMEPLISSILGGSLLSMIPGSVSITNLIANSILEGSINALLTLRVGIVTMNYLGSLKDADNQVIKRSATIESTKLLGQIIKDGSLKVVQTMVKSIKKSGIENSKKWNPFTKL